MQRVGWIRIGALGDLLVGLASLRETLDHWPAAKVTVIGSKLWLEILQPGVWNQIDRVAVVEKRGTSAEIYEIVDGAWAKSTIRDLREELKSGYDAVFNARVDSARQGFAAFFARVPERWGSAAGPANFIYNRRAPHDGKDPVIHERDVPLLLMDEAEARLKRDSTFRSKGLEERIQLSPRIRKWRTTGLPCPRRIDTAHVHAQLRTERYFLVNPTSSRREKAWPAIRFRDLLRAIEQRELFAGLLPVVVGSPAETEWLREVAGHHFRVLQPKSIGELFDVVAGAQFLLTNTSSVQFIAASVGTKTLTLMGRAKPEIWGPLGPADQYVQGQEPDDIESMFERELKAYESISVEAVLAKLQAL